MNVRRRNRLIRVFHGALACVPLAVIGWALWQTRHPRGSGATAARLAVVAAVVLIPPVWATIKHRRATRDMNEALREAGIDPDEVPAKPLPLVPQLRLTKDRDQLFAGVLFLVLLISVFVAYYAGWIARWMGEPVEPVYAP